MYSGLSAACLALVLACPQRLEWAVLHVPDAWSTEHVWYEPFVYPFFRISISPRARGAAARAAPPPTADGGWRVAMRDGAPRHRAPSRAMIPGPWTKIDSNTRTRACPSLSREPPSSLVPRRPSIRTVSVRVRLIALERELCANSAAQAKTQDQESETRERRKQANGKPRAVG